MLKQQLNNKCTDTNCPFNVNKKTSKIMVRYMPKLSSITYKALTELINGNPKIAAVVAECVGRATGVAANLGLAVLANSGWRTEVKPNLILFLNKNLAVVVEQIKTFSITHSIATSLVVTAISLVSAYNISTEIEYSGLPNQDNEGAKTF